MLLLVFLLIHCSQSRPTSKIKARPKQRKLTPLSSYFPKHILPDLQQVRQCNLKSNTVCYNMFHMCSFHDTSRERDGVQDWLLYQSTMVLKLSIYHPVYFPTLTCGHKLWIMTKWIKLRIQAVKRIFFHMVTSRTLGERVRCLVMQEELGVEQLLEKPVKVAQTVSDGFWTEEVFRACLIGWGP